MHLSWTAFAEEGLRHLFWEGFWSLVGLYILKRGYTWVQGWTPSVKRSCISFFAVAMGLLITAFLVTQILSYYANRIAVSLQVQAFRPRCTSFAIGSAGPKTNVISFGVEIFNPGTPSVVKDWALELEGFDKQIIRGVPVIEFGYTTNFLPNGEMTVSDYKNSLIRQTRSEPIAHGGMVEGHVSFFMFNVNNAYVMAPGAKFRLSFKDVHDKTYTLNQFSPTPTRE